MRTRYTDAQKAEALELYAEHGAAETHRRTGISLGTLKSWASRAGLQPVAAERTRAATEAAAVKWAARRQAMVDRIGAVAEKALTVAEQNLDLGATSKAKDAATTMAILVDKAQLLGGDATERTESRRLRDELLEQARENGRHLRVAS